MWLVDFRIDTEKILQPGMWLANFRLIWKKLYNQKYDYFCSSTRRILYPVTKFDFWSALMSSSKIEDWCEIFYELQKFCFQNFPKIFQITQSFAKI